MSQTYIDYDFDFKDRYYDLVMEFGGNLKLLRNKPKKPVGKILFVLDHIPTEDLESGEILSGYTDTVFHKLANLATNFYMAEYHIDEFDYLVVNYNCFKTYGKSEEFQNEAKLEFNRRLRTIIGEYKPDVVHTFGKDPQYAISRDKITELKGNDHSILGVPVKASIKVDKKTHKFKHVSSVSFNPTIANRNMPLHNNANLLGYMSRNMISTLEGGRLKYKIPFISDEKKKAYKTHYVTTIKALKSCLKKMAKEKYVCIDTETENLYRVSNKIQTVQMCADGKNAYVIPIYHMDTPFMSKELKIVKRLFRNYFESENNNRYQIYANAQFDLNVMRSNFEIRYYKSDVWDVQAGEFGLDENMKVMFSVVGAGYYALGNLSVQYGCYAFVTNTFGKEDRATISKVHLTEPVLDYCSLDVVVPWHIFFQQLQRAKDIGYDKYESLVGNQISDQLHTFSSLESTGAYTDVEYLFKLDHPNSPINLEISKIEAQIYTSPEVQKVNEMISADKNVPKTGLFGKVKIKENFSLNKDEHKQMLFFDVMELEPIDTSAKKKRPNGKPLGKIDKNFQKEYKDVKLVQLFSDWQKACKLRNAYVKNLLKLWAADDDFKFDQRIRPNYGYRGVVTGRTSASDPNLQQVPSRSVLGKLIKRLFASRKGKLLIKVDYSAHEVRGWSIISGDKGVADLFQTGADLRERFRLVPDPLIARRIVDEGDVHRLNASYFFSIPITMRDKIAEVRNSVKTVIFGLIYQQGDKGLAAGSGQTVEKIVELKEKFLKRFPVGLKWFDKVKKFARKNFFVESPVGRRRHLWALMLPQDYPFAGKVISSQERRSVNSPVQGFGSDLMMIGIRNINRMMFEHFEDTGYYPDMHLSVSVHDSLTVECGYEDVWLALDIIERGLTTEVVKEVQKRVDYEFTSLPEIDFEIGATEKHVEGWDFSYEGMKKIIKDTLNDQVNDLGYKDLDVDKAYHTIMETQYATMPDWMKKQLWSNNIQIESMGKDIRTSKEKKLIAKYLKEIPKNAKELARREKEELELQGGTKVGSTKRRAVGTALKEAREKKRALRKLKELENEVA